MNDISLPQASWRCVAGSAQRSYLIEHLDRTLSSTQLTIYNSPQIDMNRVIEVVELTITRTQTAEILGTGVAQDGRRIKIYVFQRSVDFTVEEPPFEPATGVCSYLTDWQ